MILTITGPRVFDDKQAFVNGYATLPKKPRIKTIVTADAYGVESLAKRYARHLGIMHVELEPEWRMYGELAPYENHKMMVKACDGALVYQDGLCPFTHSFLHCAKRRKLPVIIYNIHGLTR